MVTGGLKMKIVLTNLMGLLENMYIILFCTFMLVLESLVISIYEDALKILGMDETPCWCYKRSFK